MINNTLTFTLILELCTQYTDNSIVRLENNPSGKKFAPSRLMTAHSFKASTMYCFVTGQTVCMTEGKVLDHLELGFLSL